MATKKVWFAQHVIILIADFKLLLNSNFQQTLFNDSRYEKHSPPNSFIHVDDFSSPQELAKYLNYLDSNDTAYQDYLYWRFDYVHKCPPNVLCDVCKKLHEVQGIV
jgi:hypothetical protein